MAKFFHHDSRRVRQQNGLQADPSAHRISLYSLRRAPRPRLRRRPAAHRQALVQQRRCREIYPQERQRVTSMLELRPTCQNCNKALPPDSLEARICTYECTFCATCVDSVLENVCPNCGGGFVPRRIRPSKNWKGDNYIGTDPERNT